MARQAGARIRLIRELSGLSQRTVYEAIGIDQSTWCKWELGKRSPDTLAIVRFCNRFRVSMDFIYLGDPQRTNPVLLELIRAAAPDLIQGPT